MPRELIPSQTLGIDLASQPKDTGVCLIDWSGDAGEVLPHGPGVLDDDRLVSMMLEGAVGKVGIDAPFGWPVAFIDAVTSYRDTGTWLDLEANELRFRATETRVAAAVGQQPLSVAMSDLAWPAMRCARILSRLAGEHGVLDRTGRGRVAEVYPMAALRRWGVIEPGTPPSQWTYKGDAPGRRERREQHLARLADLLGSSVSVSADRMERFAEDDDDFDAFVSALVARAVARGLTDPIPAGQGWLALREGWIHLPLEHSIGQLAGV